MMRGSENDELAEKQYNPFIANKAFSYHPDTIGYANEMNLLSHIDKKLQYEYLINIVRPQKRYAKWSKKENGDIDLVKEYFGYNDSKAEQALLILNKQQLQQIKQCLEKGGKYD